MSKNEEQATSEQVEQTAPAEAPEAVEEQAVQAESETAAEAVEKPTAPENPQEDPAPEPPKRPQIVVDALRNLNLREGPHISYDIKAVLPDGDVVEILDLPKDVEVPGWALVETSAGIGWVNTNFLREMDP